MAIGHTIGSTTPKTVVLNLQFCRLWTGMLNVVLLACGALKTAAKDWSQ
jgi:hypothetical protein